MGRERETVKRLSQIENIKRIFLQNVENSVKENCFESLIKREEKEIFCFKILKIEKRNENTILQLEREKHESFLLKIFSRSRLLSMTDLTNSI